MSWLWVSTGIWSSRLMSDMCGVINIRWDLKQRRCMMSPSKKAESREDWGNKLKIRWLSDLEYPTCLHRFFRLFGLLNIFLNYCQLLKFVISDFPGQIKESDNTWPQFLHYHHRPGILFHGVSCRWARDLQVSTSQPIRLCQLLEGGSVLPGIWVFNTWGRKTLIMGPLDSVIYYEVKPANEFVVVLIFSYCVFFFLRYEPNR